MTASGSLSYFIEIFSRSGGIGLVIAFFFFICLGVGIERALFWLRLLGLRRMLGFTKNRTDEKRIARTEKYIAGGDLKQAARIAHGASNAALKTLGEALGKLHSPTAWVQTRSHVIAGGIEPNLTQGRSFLITAIQGFGLLGMLGTCFGLYVQLSSFGAEAASVGGGLQGAMSGMGVAFTTTLLGLGAAGLTTLIYFPNEVLLTRFQRELRRLDGRIQAALVQAETGGQRKS